MNFNPIDLVNGAVDKVGDTVRDAIGLGRTKSTSSNPAHFDLDRFKSEVFENGLAEEDRFEVFLGTPLCLQGTPMAQYIEPSAVRVESVYFPPMSIYSKQSKIFGPAEQRPIMADYGGDGLTITFLMDRDMNTKKMFDWWMRSIIDDNTQTVAYQDEYTAMINIKQLDRDNKVQYQAVIQGAYPKSAQIMNLSMTSTGQFHRLQVTFAYRKWLSGEVTNMQAAIAQQANSVASAGGDTVKSVATELKTRTNSLRNIAEKYGLDMKVSTII